MSIKGIDVSKHNGVIDWKKVRADGVSFAIIRAGIGISVPKDPMFESNYSGAKAAGVDVGCYWFLRSVTTEGAVKEARQYLEIIKGKQFEYPVYLDLEDDPTYGYYVLRTGKANCTALAEAFCGEVQKAGYFAGLYISRSPLQTHIEPETAKKYALWVAEYNSKCNYEGSYGIWQRSAAGRVNGISGNVDMNECYIEYPKIIKAEGRNGFAKEKNEKYRVQREFDTLAEAQAVNGYLKGFKIVKVVPK